jgi:hypothetical protein
MIILVQIFNVKLTIISFLLFLICQTPDITLTIRAPVEETTPVKNTPTSSQFMTPGTRKRKSRISKDLSSFIEEMGLSQEDSVDAITLALKNLGLLEAFKYMRKPSKAGRKLTPIETRKAVWNFWHSKAICSTLTSRPAKLKVDQKTHIQSGLDFVDSVNIITQRGRKFYESNWMITIKTLKQLFCEYLEDHIDMQVSWGTFLALRLFYIRSATTSDIEMCCCKKHLHARWSINALIDCAKKKTWI